VHIYVPLDTVRDYISAEDAASVMIGALRSGGAAGETRVEIVASERPTSIAEIVASFRRISRRSPRIISSASRLSALYPRQVRFRSVARTQTARPPATSLLVGIHSLLRAEQRAFATACVPEP
jgi:UDP-glucose 4-epimerase